MQIIPSSHVDELPLPGLQHCLFESPDKERSAEGKAVSKACL